jgi:hypothetical protein
MLPHGSLKNVRSEFSKFALSDEENVFVSTYANYDPKLASTCLSTTGRGGCVSPTPTNRTLTDRTD